MAKKPSQKNSGRVSQVIGAVVDVEFDDSTYHQYLMLFRLIMQVKN